MAKVLVLPTCAPGEFFFLPDRERALRRLLLREPKTARDLDAIEALSCYDRLPIQPATGETIREVLEEE